MLKFLAGLLAALGLGAQVATPDEPKGPEQITGELRSMVFAIKPGEIGLTPATHPHKVWGVVMETGMDRGYYTLVALADGTTSLYLSTGGGIIGAGEHAPVRKASQAFIGSADEWIGSAKAATAFPPPGKGQTTFYLLTFDGPLTYSAEEIELGEGRDALSEFFHAGHAVISAVREASP
jgi:hypothetical protein